MSSKKIDKKEAFKIVGKQILILIMIMMAGVLTAGMFGLIYSVNGTIANYDNNILLSGAFGAMSLFIVGGIICLLVGFVEELFG